MKHPDAKKIFVFFIFLTLFRSPLLLAETIEISPPVTYRVKNGPAQRVVGIEDGRLKYASLTSSRTKEVRPLPGQEFVIMLDEERGLTPEDFLVADAQLRGPGELDLTLQWSPEKDRANFSLELSGLRVILHYRQDEGQAFIRKWIEIHPAAGRGIFVDRIVLDLFKPWAAPETFPGPGQPVFVGDTFWGVAYPSAENAASSELVVCSYLVGLTVREPGYVSREAIYGISYPGQVHPAFLEGVDQMRARPARPFLLWNTWYDLFNFTDQDVIRGVANLRKNLVEGLGIKLDSVVLDDGWDDWSELWRPHRQRFPHGFGPVQAAVESLGAELGLWMSPIGGYALNHDRRIWGTLGQGYEKNSAGFCFAGKKYRETFGDRMVEYERENRVNYFKLDNLKTTCRNQAHGHRAGKYGQVGLTDAFIEVLEKARQARPEVMINFTVGSWLSPFWLRWADVLWRGENDFGFAGEGSLREQSVTYVDQVLYRRLRVENSQFPISSLMTHGVIKGRRQSFGETGENLGEFSDDVWMYFGRGVMMQELYLSPDLLSPREWQVLASAITFAREHADLLADSEMILGDPRKGEVYGFLHARAEEKIVVLRNPRKVPPSIAAGPELELPPASCRVVYSSRNQGVSAPLQPLETRVILCQKG